MNSTGKLNCRCAAPGTKLPCLGDGMCGYICQRLSSDLAKRLSPQLQQEWGMRSEAFLGERTKDHQPKDTWNNYYSRDHYGLY